MKKKEPPKYIKEKNRPMANLHYAHTIYVEKQKEAWAKCTSTLPNDAFADDVVDNDDVGRYVPRETHVSGGWSVLGEYNPAEN